MKEPRKWWIVNWGGMNQDHELRATQRPLGPEYFVEQYEVIEKSVYDELKSEAEKLRAENERVKQDYKCTYDEANEAYHKMDQLKREKEIAVEALEFYANEKSWGIEEGWDGYITEGVIDARDTEDTGLAFDIGGKKAREALDKIRQGEK